MNLTCTKYGNLYFIQHSPQAPDYNWWVLWPGVEHGRPRQSEIGISDLEEFQKHGSHFAAAEEKRNTRTASLKFDSRETRQEDIERRNCRLLHTN